MKYSILLPVNPRRPEQAVPFANLVRWSAAERLWQGQGMVLESHHLINWLSGVGIRVTAGFGVSLMPLRTPYLAALEARSVAVSTGQPVLAGFGPGAVTFQQAVLGKPYRSQLRACREYLRIVRALVAGEAVDVDGEYYSMQTRLAGFHEVPVSVGLGVLREKMAGVAGELADAAITWMCPASYLDDTLVPAMRAADRAVPGAAKVTAVVPVALANDKRTATDLALATCSAHTQLPHYQQALRRAGIDLAGDGSAEDAEKLVKAGVFVHGTVDEVHGQLAEYAKSGVDEVVLNVSGVAATAGGSAAANELLEIISTIP